VPAPGAGIGRTWNGAHDIHASVWLQRRSQRYHVRDNSVYL
jgi:hypothetical protein